MLKENHTIIIIDYKGKHMHKKWRSGCSSTICQPGDSQFSEKMSDSFQMVVLFVSERCLLSRASWLVRWLAPLLPCLPTHWTWCEPGWQSQRKKCKHPVLCRGSLVTMRNSLTQFGFLFGQVQQHYACLCADLPGGRSEDSLQRLHSDHPGCHPICGDHVFHL